MVRRWVCAVVAMVVLAGVLPALAQERMELFIRNRPFTGQSRMLGKELHAALDDLLRDLDYSWTEDGDRLMIWSRPGGGPRLEDRARRLVVDGQAVQVAQETFGGRLYVWVADFARATGARFQANKALGTADYFPASALGSGGETARKTTDGRGSNGSPVRLQDLKFRLEAPQGAEHPVLRGYAVVQNTSGSKVEDVLLKVDIRDPKGDSHGGYTWAVGSLGAGEQLTWQFPVWTDFDGVQDPRPVLQIEHR